MNSHLRRKRRRAYAKTRGKIFTWLASEILNAAGDRVWVIEVEVNAKKGQEWVYV